MILYYYIRKQVDNNNRDITYRKMISIENEMNEQDVIIRTVRDLIHLLFIFYLYQALSRRK
jgi:hypothetical protein